MLCIRTNSSKRFDVAPYRPPLERCVNAILQFNSAFEGKKDPAISWLMRYIFLFCPKLVWNVAFLCFIHQTEWDFSLRCYR